MYILKKIRLDFKSNLIFIKNKQKNNKKPLVPFYKIIQLVIFYEMTLEA